MTVGESIQKHRKQLAWSQEELGNKLLVSRQTISLWEKDQTLPTIDNLIRLKALFGVSVDELLGFQWENTHFEDSPQETYQFHYTRGELDEVFRLQRNGLVSRFVLFLILSLLFLCLVSASSPDAVIGICLGIFIAGAGMYIKRIHAFRKAWKNSLERIGCSTYQYRLWDDSFSLAVYRDQELISNSKFAYEEIEQIRQAGNWLLLNLGGRSLLVRKSDLQDQSAFFRYMRENPSKKVEIALTNKRKLISWLLFAASLASILGALISVNAVSSVNGLFVENMWLCFVWTPLPIASFVFGLVMKTKGHMFRKNTVAGIVITVVLCLYGMFAFAFHRV